MVFDTKNDKLTFLKHAKHLKKFGLRHDDKVATKAEARLVCGLQQSENKRPQAFLQRIFTKIAPCQKMCTCKRNGANTAPVAQAWCKLSFCHSVFTFSTQTFGVN